MTPVEELLLIPPFSLGEAEKERELRPILNALTMHHRAHCTPYHQMLTALGQSSAAAQLEDIPFLPVGLFKELSLHSIEEAPTQIIHSSGTTGQQTSQIHIDLETSNYQRQALVCITSDFVGEHRLPMLILDSEAVLKPPLRFSARGAGVSGFSLCASKRVFALHEDGSLNLPAIHDFLGRYGQKPFLLFGFTFLVWRSFYQALQDENRTLDCQNGTLIHGGGWKALQAQSVSRETFHEGLKQQCNLTKIHDYYGMAEQAGSIFFECEAGHLHASVFSHVIVRDHRDFSPCPMGQRGIVQVLSVLPHSYPGHSLLTEDEGMLLGVDDCTCGRKGQYFKVFGRLPKAELRGCSDVQSMGL